MLEGLRGYVTLVNGLTETSAARAREVAQVLLSQGGVAGVPSATTAMAAQAAGLAEDLLSTARDNRGALLELIGAEVEKAVNRLGLVTIGEVDTMRARVAELESLLALVVSKGTAFAMPKPKGKTDPEPAEEAPPLPKRVKVPRARVGAPVTGDEQGKPAKGDKAAKGGKGKAEKSTTTKAEKKSKHAKAVKPAAVPAQPAPAATSASAPARPSRSAIKSAARKAPASSSPPPEKAPAKSAPAPDPATARKAAAARASAARAAVGKKAVAGKKVAATKPSAAAVEASTASSAARQAAARRAAANRRRTVLPPSGRAGGA